MRYPHLLDSTENITIFKSSGTIFNIRANDPAYFVTFMMAENNNVINYSIWVFCTERKN
jgi:hypothetical protein